MRRIAILIIILALFYLGVGFAQNPINPYANYIGLNPPGYSITQTSVTFNYSAQEPALVPAYNGEYMIDLHKLYWFTQESGDPDYDFRSLCKSYTMEVVSFPFTMDCAFTPGTGCTGTTTRDFNLPSDLYSSATDRWGANLWRIRDHIPFAPLSGVSGTVSSPESLVSNGFHTTCYETPPPTGTNYYRNYLPHTIIKHTVYIHCGPNATDPIATSFSWVYDNTRGRMRDYPFYPQNTNCSPCEATYDVCFRPYFLHRPDNHSYAENNNDLLFTNGTANGTIDYFPHSDIDPSTCLPYPTTADQFYVFDNNILTPDYWYTFPGNYSLVSSLLYRARGLNLAGYSYDAGNNELLEQEGITHTYNINSNFDISIINPSEKIFYNPSEVNVTASNLVFPSYYTFKTIRGQYPLVFEVSADNNSDNGGPFYPESLTPVKTDLYSENANDPFGDTDYASRYYLKSGSMITVATCVKLYDVTFDVEQGATLIINDYDQIFGKEDKSYFDGRYKLRGLGGAILRNYTDNQFVQNGIVTQTNPLNYIAYNSITAGFDVDNDQDQQDGNYEIHTGADVTFTAGDNIHLTNGFNVQGGTFHAVINDNISTPPQCFFSNVQNGGNRVVIKEESEVSESIFNVQLEPNPATDLTTICSENLPILNISIKDISGKNIFIQQTVVSRIVPISLANFKRGMYIVQITAIDGSICNRKLVVN